MNITPKGERHFSLSISYLDPITPRLPFIFWTKFRIDIRMLFLTACQTELCCCRKTLASMLRTSFSSCIHKTHHLKYGLMLHTYTRILVKFDDNLLSYQQNMLNFPFPQTCLGGSGDCVSVHRTKTVYWRSCPVDFMFEFQGRIL